MIKKIKKKADHATSGLKFLSSFEIQYFFQPYHFQFNMITYLIQTDGIYPLLHVITHLLIALW